MSNLGVRVAVKKAAPAKRGLGWPAFWIMAVVTVKRHLEEILRHFDHLSDRLMCEQ